MCRKQLQIAKFLQLIRFVALTVAVTSGQTVTWYLLYRLGEIRYDRTARFATNERGRTYVTAGENEIIFMCVPQNMCDTVNWESSVVLWVNCVREGSTDSLAHCYTVRSDGWKWEVLSTGCWGMCVCMYVCVCFYVIYVCVYKYYVYVLYIIHMYICMYFYCLFTACSITSCNTTCL